MLSPGFLHVQYSRVAGLKTSALGLQSHAEVLQRLQKDLLPVNVQETLKPQLVLLSQHLLLSGFPDLTLDQQLSLPQEEDLVLQAAGDLAKTATRRQAKVKAVFRKFRALTLRLENAAWEGVPGG